MHSGLADISGSACFAAIIIPRSVHLGLPTDIWRNMLAVDIIMAKPRPTPNIGNSVGVLRIGI